MADLTPMAIVNMCSFRFLMADTSHLTGQVEAAAGVPCLTEAFASVGSGDEVARHRMNGSQSFKNNACYRQCRPKRRFI